MIIAESVEKLYQKLTSLKVNIDNKGLRVNLKKTKVMVSDQNMKCIETFMKYLLDSGMWPYWFDLAFVVILFSAQYASTGFTKSASDFMAD